MCISAGLADFPERFGSQIGKINIDGNFHASAESSRPPQGPPWPANRQTDCLVFAGTAPRPTNRAAATDAHGHKWPLDSKKPAFWAGFRSSMAIGEGGSGAARGNRTPDPIITNDVLYHLSYCGNAPST